MDTGALVFLFEPFNHLGWLGILALLGIYSGIVLFLKGFRMLQRKRLILNTPQSKIRSASMGLVEVTGMAAGPQTIPAGITGKPCYYYRASAWQQSESGNQQEWQRVADETVSVPFFVDDGTGHILVYPQGAQLDVHRSFREEYGASFFASREMVPESVRKFLLRHGIIPSGTIRLEERCILEGYPLFVFGTLGENPARDSATPDSHLGVAPSPINAHPITPWPSGKSILEPLDRVTGVRVQTSYTVVSHSRLPDNSSDLRIPDPAQPGVAAPARALNVSRSNASAQTLTAVGDRGGASSSDGVTKRTANSQGNWNAPGAKAPEFDLHPHAAITRGERNELFAISSRSQREIAQSLGWKAIACIWGGPVIAVSSLCFLIIYLAWS